jgi:hypothetical protein
MPGAPAIKLLRLVDRKAPLSASDMNLDEEL